MYLNSECSPPIRATTFAAAAQLALIDLLCTGVSLEPTGANSACANPQGCYTGRRGTLQSNVGWTTWIKAPCTQVPPFPPPLSPSPTPSPPPTPPLSPAPPASPPTLCHGIMTGDVLSECSAMHCDPIYDAPYDAPTTTADVKHYPIGSSPYGHVLIGATTCEDNSSFAIAAFGTYDQVFLPTSSQSQAHARRLAEQASDDVFWYFVPGRSMGFSARPDIQLSAAPAADDTAGGAGAQGVSWMVAHGGFYYATLDRTAPNAYGISCQRGRLSLPPGCVATRALIYIIYPCPLHDHDLHSPPASLVLVCTVGRSSPAPPLTSVL